MKDATKLLAWCFGLALAYLLAYCLLLRTEKQLDNEHLRYAVNPIPTGHLHWKRVATYRWGGKAAQQFFAPANAIDRQRRPEYWGGVRDASQFTQSLDIPLNPSGPVIEWQIGEGIGDAPCVPSVHGLKPRLNPGPSLLQTGGISLSELLGTGDLSAPGLDRLGKQKPPSISLTPPWKRN